MLCEWSGAAGPGCVLVGGSGPGLQRESLHHVSDVGHAGLLGLLLDVLQCAHLQSGTPGGINHQTGAEGVFEGPYEKGVINKTYLARLGYAHADASDSCDFLIKWY